MSDVGGSTGARARYRMPAEWWAHRATWLVWPHNTETWPGRLEAVERSFARMVRALVEGEAVWIVRPPALEPEAIWARLEEAGVARHAPVRFVAWPSDDSWVRDTGPTVVIRERTPEGPEAGPRFERAHIDWRFNAWGGKYPPWDADDALAGRMADWLGEKRIEPGIVCEGGSIEVDGRGTLLTTEQCLLNPNRNPALGREQIEARLREALGIERVLWLGEGICGDDTDGHIDDIARFVDPDTIVAAVEPERNHPNHAPLAENLERLRRFRTKDGRPYRVIELPQPPDVRGPDGELLPASYANFYIANAAVLVPAYEPEADARARAVLARCFPNRRLVMIPSRDLVLGLGSVHCLTQQVPAI